MDEKVEKLDNRAEAEFKIDLAKYYQCYFETFASLKLDKEKHVQKCIQFKNR